MRVILQIASKFVLPLEHTHILQGFVYNLTNPYADFLHNGRLECGNKKFKEICFSRLIGKYQHNDKEIVFNEGAKLTISLFDNAKVFAIKNAIERNCDKQLQLGNNFVRVRIVNISQRIIKNNEIIVDMISPLENHITNDKEVIYLNPLNEQWKINIKKNLVAKAKAIYNEDWQDKEFDIEPINYRTQSIKYKTMTYIAVRGQFKITGDLDMLNLAYVLGIGSGNGKGFGLFKVVA